MRPSRRSIGAEPGGAGPDGAGSGLAISEGAPLVAVSYNIQKGIGADLRRRPERIMAVLAEIGADLVVLQEADRRFGSRRSVLHRDLLAAHGWRTVPFQPDGPSIGWHGNAVLLGPRVEVRGQRRLTIPTLEPRGAVMADLAVDGSSFRLVGMHLALLGLLRRRQARAVCAALAAADGDPPAILMGDLNEWRGASGCIAEFTAGHGAVLTGPTYPAPLPFVRLDRIFLSRRLVAEAAGVHRSRLAAVASDHLPAWVRTRIPRAG